MGYYTGNGVVSGGGVSTRTLKSFYEWGSHAVRQRSRVSTVKKSGVSLATAQAATDSDDLTPVAGGSGALAWIIFDAEGDKISPSYSQIGDSNLYDLVITTERLTCYWSHGNPRQMT